MADDWEHLRDEAPYPEDRQRMQEQVDEAVAGLARGAMTQGVPIVDDMDPRTWLDIADENDERRKFAEEFYGPDYRYEGASPMEMRIARQVAEAKADSLDAYALKQGELDQGRKQKVWNELLTQHDTRDISPQEWQAALGRLTQRHGLDVLRQIADSDVGRAADMLHEEALYGGNDDDDYSGSGGSGAAATVMGGGEPAGPPHGYEPVDDGDALADVRDWQIRNGWHR